MNIQKNKSYDAALDIIKKLRANGHQALLAGGCVRDMLLDLVPKDFDVATDAIPERVQELFPRARHIGAQFGVMLVQKFGRDIEVATFRSDGIYSDGRHPDDVTFGSDVEDARRRDFTINGLFYDPIDNIIIDHVDGRKDLDANLIRSIGDPDQRFSEDHLRMLRAVRFSARLGFEIESHTAEAIKRLAKYLARISPERIWMELEQIVTAPARTTGWSLLIDLGLRDHLVDGWRGESKIDDRVMRRFKNLPDREISSSLAMASTFVEIAPNTVADWCRTLRLSNRQSDAIVWLVQSLPSLHNENSLELADLKVLMAEAYWLDLIELFRADLLAQNLKQDVYENICSRASAIPKDAVAPPPLLTGDAFLEMGMKPGPEFGDVIKAVYRSQLNEDISTNEQARLMARNLMNKNMKN